MEEKRRFPRYCCSFKVCYATNGIACIEGNTVAKDISRGGLRLAVSRIIRKGNLLRLKIFHRGDKSVEVIGKVKWVGDELAPSYPLVDAGVEFTRAKPSDLNELLASVQ